MFPKLIIVKFRCTNFPEHLWVANDYTISTKIMEKQKTIWKTRGDT